MSGKSIIDRSSNLIMGVLAVCRSCHLKAKYGEGQQFLGQEKKMGQDRIVTLDR